MRIRYGEDLDKDGNSNRFVPANFESLLPERTVSIRFNLLLRTTEPVNNFFDSNYYMLDDSGIGSL